MGEKTIFRKPLTETDMGRMRIPKRYWSCAFDEISDDVSGGVADEVSPKGLARRYLVKLDEMLDRGIGILLWGANGRGKTGVSVVVCKEARRRGYTVLFAECADLKRCVIDRVPFDDDQSVLERARSVDLLVLDDLGKGVQDRTGFGARLLDELIRHRNASQLSTIITTNMGFEQMDEELKKSTIHSLKECMVPAKIMGPDRRDEAKQCLLGLLSAEG